MLWGQWWEAYPGSSHVIRPWTRLTRRRTAAAQVTLVIGACWAQESVPAGAKT